MGTPALSCSTDAFSNALTADSDDEGPESSMWVQQEGHTSSELPSDFLEPLSPGVEVISPLPPFPAHAHRSQQESSTHESRQFWKSGDFTGSYDGATFATEGMDHARVHPKFLHSNATSHKWVLGAIAELLDNAVDEIRNGATFVKVDVIPNPRNGEPMLLIEDDGGGMDPDCMRRCMSLGYSAKSKLSNTIGQYGNGFKTSTMRLGADVLVFSRSGVGKPSESIGMMSYTFLTATGQNDIVVPIVDFQIEAFGIRKLIRSNVEDWLESMEAIEKWSPYSSQAELVNQFKSMPRRQGTKVIIYNLWEDEEGLPELDFTTDPIDIQIRNTSRDERNLKMAARYASCWHYLTYRHSLRSYISILYLRLPSRFRIFLRGKQVQHHSLRHEMMLLEEVTYRPKDAGHSKAVVTLGFVKDAKEHLDISGFNVYHKNRLIKPFWRIWNPSDTRGRGIIGILEANFVEPAHDKQGFERTIVLSRLEARLVEMQKSYWSKNCHKIGYTNASLRNRVRPKSVDNNGTGNGDKMETAQRNSEDMPMVDIAASNVHSSANGHRDVYLVQGIGGKEPDSLIVSSALVLPPVQETCVPPARLGTQEQNLPLGSIDTITIGSGKRNSVFFDSQVPAHVAQEGVPLDKVPDAALNPARLDSQTFHPPVSSHGVSTNLQVTSLAPVNLGLQTLCPLPSMGSASAIIILDSSDNDLECDDAALEIPYPGSCDASKPIIEDRLPELVNLMRDAGAGENTSPLGERSSNIAGCVEIDETMGGLIEASTSFPAFPNLDKGETPLGRLHAKSCSQLSRRVSLDKAAPMSQVEARVERLGMESCALFSAIVTTSKEAPPPTELIPGLENTPRKQTNNDAGEPETQSFLQGKPVLENTPCPDTTMIDAADLEASDPLKSSTISVEGHVSAIFDLDDLFDSSTPQDEVQPLSPQTLETRDASVTSSVVNMDVTLPDILETATLEDSFVPFNSSGSLNRNDTTISGIVRHDDGNVVQENPTNNYQLSYKDVVKDSPIFQLLSGRNIQQVARLSSTEIDATIRDFEEQGDAHLVAKQTSTETDEGQHVSAPLADLPLATPAIPTAECSGLEQGVIHHGDTSQAVIQHGDTSDNDQASRKSREKDMAMVLLEPTSIHSQSAIFGSIQASNQVLQQVHAVVNDTVCPALPTRDISSSCNGDLSIEDGSSRLLFAKKNIEFLQQSIEVVVAEADDIREQLQKQRRLQDLDMESLNMELETALARLEELKR